MSKINNLEDRINRLELLIEWNKYINKIQLCPSCKHYTLMYLSNGWNCTVCGGTFKVGLINE